ncbi:hypothetical protein Pcinc_008752 [Petrolisthes cinctipes]|uniref:Uncharacterized protein n=1 Tax=Petrolisthes cinctipes TaxID=88211 RepID=A0AAE1G8R3_PETCI|nr:hypothetical protein Pcinc_008752 [Petrolisthes cinctipes]
MAGAAGQARQQRQGEVLVWSLSAVFSLASLAAAFIVTLLPETKNKIMAQGIDDQPEHVMEQYDPTRTQRGSDRRAAPLVTSQVPGPSKERLLLPRGRAQRAAPEGASVAPNAGPPQLRTRWGTD